MNSLALTYAQKPYEGQTWDLRRTVTGFALLDPGGQIITTIRAADASHRFRFPSFWASVTFLEVLMPDGSTQSKALRRSVAMRMRRPSGRS